jgi:carboxymethylenebutenolidase
MDQKIIDLYDDFIHGGMNRRDFLERLTVMVGSTAAATAAVSLLQSDFAHAQTVPANDPRLATERVTIDTPKGKVSGYLARPKAKGQRPAIVVIHENRGLHPHIQDVARRLAMEGFLAFAPDLLSLVGGTPANEDEALALHPKLNQDDAVVALTAAVSFLKKHPESTGKVGAVGFCFGGLMVNRLAVASRELDAGVPYYGRQVSDADVPKITAPLLIHYAENDKAVNAGIEAFEAALKANKKRYTIYIYAGAQHAFNNDTGKARYDKAAADLAWGRTLAFFKETLGAPPNAA